MFDMRRREFIMLLGGAAASPLLFPLAAHAQQADRIRRIGILTMAARNGEGHSLIAEFRRTLHEQGWTDGRTVQLEERWSDGNSDLQAQAAELVHLKPDVRQPRCDAT